MRYLSTACRIVREQGISEFGKFAAHKLRERYSRIRFPRIIQQVSKDWDNDRLINFAMDACGGLIKPQQNKREITELLELLRDIKPSTILEIGSAQGGTLFLWSKVAADNAYLIALDRWIPPWRQKIFNSFTLGHQKLQIVVGSSHIAHTKTLIEEHLNGKSVDFLFIDGDHTYNGVRADYTMYSPLVKKGGIIVFHDILHKDETGGVTRFWSEVKEQYCYKEIVYSTGMGIGILWA